MVGGKEDEASEGGGVGVGDGEEAGCTWVDRTEEGIKTG